MKTCEQCGVEFNPRKDYQKFCSVACRSKAHSRWWGNARRKPDETEEQFRARIRGYAARKGKKYADGHTQIGLCRACAKPVVGNCISWCERHWIQQAVRRAGLHGVHWIAKLQKLLELQNYTCPYTGKKLEIGVNASLDHVQPKSRFPELANCYENLEWIDADVNRAKRALTKEEFIALCQTVSGRHEWPNPERMVTYCG